MIQTLHLFRPLNVKLISLLQDLSPSDWSKKTVAGNWTIKDVATHLLDGSMRVISVYRDHWELPPSEGVKDYNSLVNFLNGLNADWVTATRRLSPALLVELLDTTHETFIRCFEQLDPSGPAKYSVAWAGETVSTNAFHVAREYTEKWHHQQQIREATGKQEILTPEFYHPVLETFMMALPHAYRDTAAPKGTKVTVEITTEAGGEWSIQRNEKAWTSASVKQSEAARITIPGELAWKLFTKAVPPETGRKLVTIRGDESLAWPALRMLSVMA